MGLTKGFKKFLAWGEKWEPFLGREASLMALKIFKPSLFPLNFGKGKVQAHRLGGAAFKKGRIEKPLEEFKRGPLKDWKKFPKVPFGKGRRL